MSGRALTDWQEWHEEYADPASGLSRRRRAVQDRVRAFLDERAGPVRVVSACAGEGRDLLDVLADRPDDAARVSGRLVELDPDLAARARARADGRSGLDLEVVEGDAGVHRLVRRRGAGRPRDAVRGLRQHHRRGHPPDRPGHPDADGAAAPRCVWTRGSFETDMAPVIAGWFEEAGFERTSYHADDEHGHRVVEHRLVVEPQAFRPGEQLFTFVR